MPGIVKIAFLADVGAAKVGLTQFSSDVKDTVNNAGESWGKLKDKLKIGALAAGAAATAAIAEGLDVDAARDKLSAQLGLVGEDAARVGKAAGAIYADGFGESMDDVSETLRAAVQNGVVSAKASSDELKSVGEDIQNYITLSGEEAQATTEAVAQILKNKLAPNAKRAFDLLVKGQQLGVNKAEDLLDTFTEYSTQFRALGLDGPKALGLLSQGLKAGARDADTVADALKEFAIRAKDGSKTTVDGFKSIGLNADKMQAVFAKGGKGAADGLDLVLDRLRAVKDPAEQSRIAVELFGTKSEDLQAALLALDPSEAVKGLGDLEGAADRAGQTLNDNAKARFTAWKRTLQVDVINFVADKVIPGLDKLAGWFHDEISPEIDRFKDKAVPKAKQAVKELGALWNENKDDLETFTTNLGRLADTLSEKLVPVAEQAYPAVKRVAELDLSQSISALQSLNTLLSKGDGSGETATGVLAKIRAVGALLQRAVPFQGFASSAGNAIVDFGDRFVKDTTVRKKITDWIVRNFSNLVGLLPLGQLNQAGLKGAEAVARGFGLSNPSATVSKWMGRLGALAIQYNPVAVFFGAGGILGRRIADGLVGTSGTVAGRVRTFARNMGSALIGALPGGAVLQAGAALGLKLPQGILRGITSGVGIVFREIRSIPGRVAANGGNWGGALVGAGRSIISGLVSGIRSAMPSLQSVLSSVTSVIPNWKGPLDKDKRLLRPAGAAIMGGLMTGITSELPKLKTLLGDVSGSITDGMSASPSVSLSTSGVAAASVGLGGGQPVTVNVYALTAGQEVGRQVIDSIGEYERLNGTSWRRPS